MWNQTNRFSWILKSTVGMVLTLLATTALLEAQSGEFRVSGHHEWLEERAGNASSVPYVGLGFDNCMTSTAASGGTGAVTELPTETFRTSPSAVVRGLCFIRTRSADWFQVLGSVPQSFAAQPEPSADADKPGEGSKPTSAVIAQNSKLVDFNESIYYKNKLEFSLDGGWLPINIPFVFDVFLGDAYTMTDLKYTLVPIIGSLRWQMDNVGGPWIFRGNWDLTASAAVTVIPRGPETRYYAWVMGIRRNLVPRHSRIAPYFDGRLGLGNIDAKAPLGVLYAQGQNFTFTMNMGSGVRYNFSPRYSISAGLNWMHISNLYLSEPKFANYGINVYGPMFGIDVRLGTPHRRASE